MLFGPTVILALLAVLIVAALIVVVAVRTATRDRRTPPSG